MPWVQAVNYVKTSMTKRCLSQLRIVIFYFNTALNQLAGTGWLMGDALKNFISRLIILKGCLNFAGLAPMGCQWQSFSVTRQHPPPSDSQP